MLRRLIAVAVGSAVFLSPAVPAAEVQATPVTKVVTSQTAVRKITTVTTVAAIPTAVRPSSRPINLRIPGTYHGYPRRKYFARHYILRAYGWRVGQFGCLNRLWTKESNWGIKIPRPSGPGGIPQALPATKMKRFGNMYHFRVQIVWGAWYIKHRWHSPCRAWAHSRSHNWY